MPDTNKTSKIESISLKWSLISAITALVVWLGYFIASGTHRLPLVDKISVGTAILMSVIIIVPIAFYGGYTFGQRKRAIETNTQKRLWLRALSLSLAYTIIFVIFTALIIFVLSISFKGLTLDRYLSSFIIAISSALTTYVVINLSATLETVSIVNAFALFMIGGIFTSMATSINPLWWEVNFSSLGATHTFSAKVFNATLILSAVLMICMSLHLFQDLKLLVSGNKKFAQTKANFVKGMFIFIAICLAGVGLFPFYVDTFSAVLHNLSAYSMMLGFAILIIGIRYLIPALNKSFFAFSYTMLGALGLCFVLYFGFHYFNLTAFELNAFCIAFAWLIIFLRNIAALQPSHNNKID